jgi:hypothetical protein
MNTMVSQRAFAAALLDPALAAPNGLRVPAGVDPQQRFNVHRNNAVVALLDALATAFPVTQALVGDTFFRAMARERIRIDPPRSPIVTAYGEGFADFIAAFAPAAGVAYLPDMARLEYLRIQAYHAADAEPLTASDYQTLLTAPERLAATRLRLHPACRWLRSDYAVRSLWEAHQHSDRLRDVALEALDPGTPETMLLTRPQWDVRIAPLPLAGIAWLQALRDGMTLSEAASAADHDHDRNHDRNHRTPPAAQLQALLLLLLQHGLAVALESPTE